MTLTIFAIAAIPAAAVYFIGLISKNRSKTLLAAITMVLFGLWNGSPAYIITDLIFVAVAYLWTSENFTATEAKSNLTVLQPALRGVVRNLTLAGSKAKQVLVALLQTTLAIAAFFLVLACALIWYNSTSEMVDSTESQPPAGSTTSLQTRTASLPNHKKYPAERTATHIRERPLDKRHCLTLRDNDAIARCSLNSR